MRGFLQRATLPLLVAGALALLVVSILWHDQTRRSAAVAAESARVHDIALHNSDITELALSVRVGLEPNYDPLTSTMLELSALVVHLKARPADREDAEAAELRGRLAEQVSLRLELVEDLQRQHAILRNSQRYLVEARAAAHEEARRVGARDEEELDALLLSTLNALVNYDDSSVIALQMRADAISPTLTPESRPAAASFVSHLSVALAQAERVAGVIRQLRAPELVETIVSLEALQRRRSERNLQNFNFWRGALIALSIVLLGGLAVLVVALRRGASKLVEMNHGLEEKVRTRSAELAQAQKLESIGQLAAGIAHEINTPAQYVGDNLEFMTQSFDSLLTVLNAQRDLRAALEAGSVSAEELAKVKEIEAAADLEFLTVEVPASLAQAREGIGRVSQIVRAMKEFSHPGSKDKQPANLNRAIESTLTVAHNEWKYVAQVEQDFDAELPPVPCLLAEFNQVVLNIVVNAAHALAERGRTSHGDDKGVIRIVTRRDGEFACVEISDNGSGIPKAVRDKIFDPFFTTKEVGKGTGQGLAIARSVIVDKHGGELTVESEEGQGTTFRIRLPLVAKELPA